MDVISYVLSKKYTDEKCKEMDNIFQDYKNQSMLKTIGIEKELNDFKNTLHQVNVNQEAKQSTSGYGIVDLPKNAANGQVGVSVEGLTATNLVENGDFRIGTEGWQYPPMPSAISTENNIMIFTVPHLASSTRIEQSPSAFTPIVGHKYYVNGEIKSKYSNLTFIQLGAKNTGNINPTPNKWNAVNGIVKPTNTDPFRFYHICDANYVIGDEVYFRNIMAIDLTQTFGVGNEPTKEECDQIFANYFDGTKSTLGAMKVKSVGKNLFDGKVYGLMTDGGIIDGREVYKLKHGASQFWSFKGEPNTQYTLTFEYRKDGNSVGLTQFEFLYSDGTKSIVQTLSSNTWFKVIGTSLTNKTLVGFKQTYNNIGTTYIDKKTFMLEKGDTRTEYEPYKESTAYVIAKDKDNKIVNLRSLPNGIADKIDLEKGELIKSISNDIPVFDIMYESIDTTTYTNVDIIKTTAFTDAKVGTVEVDGQTRYYDKNGVELTEVAQADIDLTTSAGKYYWDIDGTLCIIVEKGTYTDVTAARTGLGITSINYQLAEPEIIPILVSGNIVSNPSGTIYFEKAQPDANVYNNGITIFEQELNIDYIDKLYKIDYQTGVKTELDASKAVIVEDRKTFTHPDLVNGDMVFFEYYYSNETTQGETTIEYYDSRYVIPDKTLPNKFYKWDIEVDNGVPSVAVTEV